LWDVLSNSTQFGTLNAARCCWYCGDTDHGWMLSRQVMNEPTSHEPKVCESKGLSYASKHHAHLACRRTMRTDPVKERVHQRQRALSRTAPHVAGDRAQPGNNCEQKECTDTSAFCESCAVAWYCTRSCLEADAGAHAKFCNLPQLIYQPLKTYKRSLPSPGNDR